MEKIRINLEDSNDRSYDILIEDGLLEKIPSLLKDLSIGKKHVVISDNTVGELYGEKLIHSLNESGIETHLITFPDGDASKKLSTVEELMGNMIRNGIDRKDAVIALGGGVTGDIAGFVASIYLRGIPFIQIPTTLLAMVDSSVGGKTGVNLQEGKNLAGTFNQPKAVYIDPQVLQTLPEVEFRNGLSEVVKYGVISDPKLFESLELTYDLALHPTSIIKRSCEIKGGIVEKDEKEDGIRKILNYGHTIGHAIETLSDYKVSHGQGIALGMILINNICTEIGILDKHDAVRINSLITKLELCDVNVLKNMSADKIWTIMLSDKKTTAGKITFIVPTALGSVKTTTEITLDHLKHVLKQFNA